MGSRSPSAPRSGPSQSCVDTSLAPSYSLPQAPVSAKIWIDPKSSLTLQLMASLPVGSTWSPLMRLCQGLLETSVSLHLAIMDLERPTKDPSSTGSFLALCCREEILKTSMEPEAVQSMDKNSMMKTFK